MIKAGSAETYESINVYLSKEKTPVAWENRVKDLQVSGMSREEAEQMANEPIELELFFEIGNGLFAVETGATESYGACSSPYTGDEIEPYED